MIDNKERNKLWLKLCQAHVKVQLGFPLFDGSDLSLSYLLLHNQFENEFGTMSVVQTNSGPKNSLVSLISNR